MLHLPTIQSLESLILGMLLIVAILAYDMIHNHRTIEQTCKRWSFLFILFIYFVLEAIGVVWFLSLGISLALAGYVDYRRNQEEKSDNIE